MKDTDEDLSQELRELIDKQIDNRWGQLYDLSAKAADSAVKYLFTTNAGGAVAVLAYLGYGSNPESSAKCALVCFFVGLLFVGILHAYNLHSDEGLFNHYRYLVNKYRKGELDWDGVVSADEKKSESSFSPYVLGYLSFAFFILGCIFGAFGIF